MKIQGRLFLFTKFLNTELGVQCGTERTEKYLALRFLPTGQAQHHVEKDLDMLTSEEARAQPSACCQAMREERQRWIDLHAFERAPLETARNLIDTRWVLKWKVVDGVRRIEARLTIRGLRDLQGPALSTFSATMSRWGQRLIVSMVVQRRWTLVSCDITQAFLRGFS